jgi:hypothetical protein
VLQEVRDWSYIAGYIGPKRGAVYEELRGQIYGGEQFGDQESGEDEDDGLKWISKIEESTV